MEKVIETYRGYELVLEEFDDGDDFVKNHYTMRKGNFVKEVRQANGVSFTYSSRGVVSRFKELVDYVIEMKRYNKLPAGFDGTPVG